MKKRVIDSIIRKNVRSAMRARSLRRRRMSDKRFCDVNANSKLTPLGLRYCKGFVRYSKQIAEMCSGIGSNTKFREVVALLPHIEQRIQYLLNDVRKFNGALKTAKAN